MPVGLNAEPGADADFPGVLGVSSHDLFGWPVFVGPRVVGWDRCTVVALGACPVAAIEDVESRATPRAAHAYVSLMRISFSSIMFSVEKATMCSNVDRQLGSSSQSQPTRTDDWLPAAIGHSDRFWHAVVALLRTRPGRRRRSSIWQRPRPHEHRRSSFYFTTLGSLGGRHRN